MFWDKDVCKAHAGLSPELLGPKRNPNRQIPLADKLLCPLERKPKDSSCCALSIANRNIPLAAPQNANRQLPRAALLKANRSSPRAAGHESKRTHSSWRGLSPQPLAPPASALV
eukprot:1760630-Rhodomonas_salina.1